MGWRREPFPSSHLFASVNPVDAILVYPGPTPCKLSAWNGLCLFCCTLTAGKSVLLEWED